jgi:hypothetical protein
MQEGCIQEKTWNGENLSWSLRYIFMKLHSASLLAC